MDAKAIVYVIDDDASVRKSLARLVRSEGLDVKTFSSARDFLSFTPLDRPGCLVLDLQMPGMTGLELQQALTEAGRSIPIIFITGFGNVPAGVQAMKAGAVDFLEKPFDDEALIHVVRRAIQRDIQFRRTNRELSAVRKSWETLTEREKEVFDLVVTGMLNKQIAFQLGITEKTIKVHRARIMQKMGAQSLADLVRFSERLK
jgi:FixJ family two-component response regulator